MKLWRGQPDHEHWRLPFSSRDKAKASFGLATVCVALAFASAFADKATCDSGGKLVCTAVRSVALAFGTNIRATEVAVWAGVAVSLVLVGLIQWRKA